MNDLANAARHIAHFSAAASDLSMFQRRICGCGEGAQVFAVYRDNHWAYVGHEAECRFAIFTKRQQEHLLDLRHVDIVVPHLGGEIAEHIGQDARALAIENGRLAFDRETDASALGAADLNFRDIDDCHSDLPRAAAPTGTVTKAGSGSTAPGDRGAC